MSEEEQINESIDRQIAFNKGKNLYYIGRDETLALTERTRELIEKKELLAAMLERYGVEALIDYTVSRALREFYHAYQYIDVRREDREDLREIYRILIDEALAGELKTKTIAKRHYRRLADWLGRTNPATRKINTPGNPMIVEIPCSEYSPTMQMEVLGLDLTTIVEPVLDLGCGEGAGLVRYLRANGIDAYGLDRSLPRNSEPHLIEANWFEFSFQPEQWGTIISNLSFSIHFLNHHLRGDGKYAAYAEKYMEILRSLRAGGSYHYAPAIPFIEEYLPPTRYHVTRESIDGEFMRAVVRRKEEG